MLFAKALKSHKIGDLLSNLGAAPAAAGPAAAGGAGPAAAAAVEEKVEEAEDVDIGTGGFFDEEDDY